MSLWSRLIGRASAPPPPPALIEPSLPAEKTSDTSLITAGLPWFPIGGMYPSNTGIPVTPMSSLQAAAVYACCKCIGEDIAGLKIQVRRLGLDGLWVTDLRHPLNRLFRRPNTWQTAFQFWAYVLVSYCLRGNAFVVIVRGLDGQVRELVPVSPDFVTMHPPIEGRGRIWYTITSRYLGGVFKIPNDDVIHMRNPVTLDGYLGASPIMCAQDVIGLALATQQHGAVLFRQGGQIAGVLKHPGKIGKEATDNIAASWADTHGGVQNAHKITVLEEGMTFEKIALTNEDAQFLQTRQFQVVDIATRIYRVPPHKVGEYGRATFSNLEQQQQQYIDDCLQPHTDQLGGLLEDQLLFDDERELTQIRWDYTTLLRGDEAQRYGSYQIGLLNGFLSRNEVRAREGLNPIPGGNEYRVPLNTADPTQPANIPQRVPSTPNGAADNGEGEGANA